MASPTIGNTGFCEVHNATNGQDSPNESAASHFRPIEELSSLKESNNQPIWAKFANHKSKFSSFVQ
jgi:hypothetical protein